MSDASTLSLWLPPFVNRLGLKIGLTVGLVAGAGALIPPGWPIWIPLLIGLGLGAVTYAAAHYWLHRRLTHVLNTLRQIRQHSFETLSAPSGPHGDELNTLIWEVYRTGQTLQNEIQDLREMESYRREFIGNVSHELKTPIFSVQGFTETLLDGALEDEEVNRSFLEKILHNVNRLDNLARDLSAISRIETGEMNMKSEAFDLDNLFDDVIDSLEIKAHEKGVALQKNVPSTLPTVYGDAERIQRVIVNLTDNAIKYNEEEGTVSLQAQQVGSGDIEVRVVDDGIGIPSEHLPRLTERFYRVDKSRSRNQGGTGLGLAIVKHILGAHDRDLHVESQPGEGSTFSFTLPTAPESTLQPA